MIDKSNPYFKQAELVGTVLPQIAKYDCFALKGGTAINLFVRNMPRLSVDIDLTYLPVEPRDKSLTNIGNTLKQIAQDIEKQVIGASVTKNDSRGQCKLTVSREGVEIKIEPNLVIRGTVFPCEDRDLCSKAKKTFEMTTRMRIVSLSDLYGGKICAALDRQHPRDLYDIKFLLDNEGISEQIRKGFLVYLVSHDRPMHESLNPIMKDVRGIYETDFQGMADDYVSYEELILVRSRLIELIQQKLTQHEKDFLISFKNGSPEWALLGVDGVEHLPAVRWKLLNIQKMDKTKRENFVRKLREVLNKDI